MVCLTQLTFIMGRLVWRKCFSWVENWRQGKQGLKLEMHVALCITEAD